MGGVSRFDPDDRAESDPSATRESSAWDPDRWWTFGEAADLAGVTHRAIADWAASGRLHVRTAWREGTEIRLVRSGDVASLAPGARRAAAARPGLDERAVFTGPRRSALGASGRPEAAPPVDPGDDESVHAAGVDPEARSWRLEVEREIERLRSEADDLREQRDAAQAMLAANEDSASRDATPSSSTHSLAMEPRRPRAAPAEIPWKIVATVAAIALVVGVSVGRLTAPGGRDVAGAQERGFAAMGPALDELNAPGTPHGSESAAAPDTGDDEPDELQAGAPAEAPADVPDRSEPMFDRTRVEGLRLSIPATYRTIVAGSESAFVDEPACVLGDLVRSDRDARVALGPCFGPLTQDGLAIAATHRVKGTPCCKHHAFVERMTGAASDDAARAPLLAEAAQSERDGLVPALLVMRAERSAARFVDAALGGWSAAGLDGGAREGTHEWRIVPTQDVLALSLTSWVIPGETGETMRFRMVLELNGLGEGDVLRSFEWLDD